MVRLRIGQISPTSRDDEQWHASHAAVLSLGSDKAPTAVPRAVGRKVARHASLASVRAGDMPTTVPRAAGLRSVPSPTRAHRLTEASQACAAFRAAASSRWVLPGPYFRTQLWPSPRKPVLHKTWHRLRSIEMQGSQKRSPMACDDGGGNGSSIKKPSAHKHRHKGMPPEHRHKHTL